MEMPMRFPKPSGIIQGKAPARSANRSIGDEKRYEIIDKKGNHYSTFRFGDAILTGKIVCTGNSGTDGTNSKQERLS